MVNEPDLREPGPHHEGALIWTLPAATEALSSAPVGGGRAQPAWIANVRVPMNYDRTDLAAHAAEVAAAEGCVGAGITFLTAASVERWCRGSRGGVTVDATVGVSKPTWAADESGGHERWAPGTINLVVSLPVTLSEAAAVALVSAVTEAKTQALADRGVPGTGTASDALAVLWPAGGPEEVFGGTRSTYGSRAALATYDAVLGAMAS